MIAAGIACTFRRPLHPTRIIHAMLRTIAPIPSPSVTASGRTRCGSPLLVIVLLLDVRIKSSCNLLGYQVARVNRACIYYA
jgi:hypothetical protein